MMQSLPHLKHKLFLKLSEKSLQKINLSLSLMCLLSAITIFCINAAIYHYQGNNYFPPNPLGLMAILVLCFLGTSLQFGIDSQWAKRSAHAVGVFTLISLIALLTNAVQLTPFKPIDSWLIAIDQTLHFKESHALAALYQYPNWVTLLKLAYDFLNIELLIVFVLLIAYADNRNHETYFLLLFSAWIGFMVYYFFPTTGPASNLKSPFFYPVQYDTGLKFFQIHTLKAPTTFEGGLIAFPSFHALWAMIAQRYFKRWRTLYFLALPVNGLIIFSCVALGWHYLCDVIFSFLIHYLSLQLLKHLKS